MSKSIATFAAATVLLSSAAFAQSVGEKTGVNSTLGIAPTTADFEGSGDERYVGDRVQQNRWAERKF